MEKLNIDEAIRCWNDPKVTFTSTYICWREHGRGHKPDFKPIKIENGIRVYIDSEDFHIDEISIDDLNRINKEEDFSNKSVKLIKTSLIIPDLIV